MNKPKSSDTIPEGYFKNAFGEIQPLPSNKKGGFIKVPGGKQVEKTVKPLTEGKQSMGDMETKKLIEEARKYKSAEDMIKDYISGDLNETTYKRYDTPEYWEEANGYTKKTDYPIEIKKIKTKDGKTIDFRKSGEKNSYVKTENINGVKKIIRDNGGSPSMMSIDEMNNKGLPIYDTTIKAFDGDKFIGWIADSFGVPEIFIHPQYRGTGIGTKLIDLYIPQFKEFKSFGKATPSGRKLIESYIKKVWDNANK